jgi:hypothetical protein
MAIDHEKEKRQLGGELVIPVLAIAFTLYFFSTIWNSPWTAKVSAFMVGGILMLVCGIFIVRCVVWLGKGEGYLGFSNLFTREDITSGRIGLFATTIGYCVFIDRLGFTLTTFLFLAVSMIVLSRGKNIGFIALVSAAMSLGGWAVFILAFDTRFPRGWFETTMKAVLANG